MNPKKPLLAFIVALVCVCAPLTAARATILWAGGEDSDFTCVGNCWGATSFYNSGYARASVGIGAESYAWPPTGYAATPAFTAVSTLWVHGVFYQQNFWNQYTPFLMVASPDGVARIIVRPSTGNNPNALQIATKNAANTITVLTTETGSVYQSAMYTLDLYINYSTSGEVALYINGNKVADYTGDVTTDSATTLDQIWLGGGANNGWPCFWSEIIAATTNTTSMRLVTLSPAANGNTDNWDTGGVSNVNETVENDATTNASGTAGQVEEYTVTSLPSGTFNVLALQLNMRAQVGATGPQHIDGMVRTGGTDYTSANLSPQQSVWGPVSTIWATNPNTGVAWTTSDLSAAGFNTGFKSAN